MDARGEYFVAEPAAEPEPTRAEAEPEAEPPAAKRRRTMLTKHAEPEAEPEPAAKRMPTKQPETEPEPWGGTAEDENAVFEDDLLFMLYQLE